MKNLFLLFYILNALNCVQARKSPLDPNNPFSLLSRILVTSSSSDITPSLSYTNQTHIFYITESVSLDATSFNVKSCTASPDLPTGLSLGSTNCKITGIPSVSKSTILYTITATNNSRSATANLTLTVSPIYRTYITSTQVAGNVTLTTADTTCNTNVNKPNSGTYKAMLVSSARRACSTSNCSGGLSENLDWVFKTSSAYFRSNGTTLVGKTNVSGIFVDGLTTSFSNSLFTYWTGMSSDFTNSANCVNWTSNSGANTGFYGSSIYINSNAYLDNGTGCNNSNYLLCVEQ